MQSYIRSISNNKNLRIDMIGILLLIAIGISGQILVSNPMNVLASNLPMLSLQDWPGSGASEQLSISSRSLWHERRVFYFAMVIFNERYSDYDYYAEISQETTWYADPAKAVAAWNDYKKDFKRTQPISQSILDRDKPTSVLFCRDNLPLNKLSCTYFAYWEHWYTKVKFQSDGDEHLSFSEVQRIIARVEQLLVSASDNP